jgi:hypothetical protein
LIALLVLAAGGAVVLLGRVGGAAVDRASARTAADAAALAGAAEGRAAAERLATADGGRIVSYRQQGMETEVRVRVGQASALARARRDAGGSGDAQAPALRAAWTRMGQLLGQAVPVQSVVASSSGQPGMAVLVAPDVAPRVASVAPQAGLCRVDERRFQVCR